NFGGTNEIITILRAVNIFFTIRKISCAVHDHFTYDRRRNNWREVFVREKFKGILPDSEAETNTIACKEIPAEAVNLGTTFGVHHAKRGHDLNMILWFE